MIRLFKIPIILLSMFMMLEVDASTNLVQTYPCIDIGKSCVSSGGRIVEGIRVTRDCWEWSYEKTCNYPSKDNCKLYEHCYDLGTKGCYLQDSQGNCVNLKKEFSCEAWVHDTKENKKVRQDLVEKDGEEGLVCEGVPCIDGNCVDKSYLTNGEMMDSVSKLYAASYASPDGDADVQIFVGSHEKCSQNMASYMNCCGIGKGWGKTFGAKCNSSEKALMEMRTDNLCVFVGQETKSALGVTYQINKHFCCFSNLLEKAIQEQGRQQLGISFGSGSDADCRGFTIEEIQKIDFSKIDFSEFIEDLKIKFMPTYQGINPEEIKGRIQDHLDIKEYDNDPYNPENNKTGLQNKQMDEVWDE